MFNGIKRRPGARLHVDLLENVSQVHLDGIDADKERSGNLFIAQPLGNKSEGLFFAFAQGIIFCH